MELSWQIEQLQLREPLRIARSTTFMKDAVVVKLTHGGVVGHGEVVASSYYNQDVWSIVGTLSELAHRIGRMEDPFELRSRLDGLVEHYASQPATLAALDAAVHDWAGIRLGLALHRLLGLDACHLQPTALTLGITSPCQAEAAARAMARRGYPIFKLKVGLPSLAEERALVSAVRLGAPDAALYLDANGGWSPDDALERIAALLEFRPTLVEQPIAPGQLDALAGITEESPVPVFVDEDALTAADVPRLRTVVHGVNIKLPKCGGIGRALAMIDAAREAGLQVMLGCMVASSLGLAPAVHLAPLADYLDLDGHLLLEHDPWSGIGGERGRLRLDGGPGLGVHRIGAPIRVGSK